MTNNPIVSEQKGKIFYGWFVVAGGFMLMSTCYAVFVNCIPVFQPDIVSDPSVSINSMTAFNTGVMLCTAVAIFASLAFGPLIDKYSSRLLGSFTVITTSVCMFLFHFLSTAVMFYILCIVAGVVVVAGTRLLASVIVANWFIYRRGLAVSIALSGSGFGGIILSQVCKVIIASPNLGWRPAFLVLAAVALVGSLPLILIAFRKNPVEKGLLPYGADRPDLIEKDKSADTPVNVSVGLKILLKDMGFWILIIGFVAMGIVNGAVITNTVTNMSSVEIDGVLITLGGHSREWATNVLSFYMFVVIVAKISLGAIYDRFGIKFSTLLGTAACLIAAVALCFPHTNYAPIIAAIAFGFGTCMGTVSPPIHAVRQYGMKDLGKVTGLITAFELMGAAVGALVSGLLFDASHSFVSTWIMVMVASAVMGVCLLVAIPAAKKLVEKRIAEGAPILNSAGVEIV